MITIVRTTNRYRRSINGAWCDAGRETEILEREESWLTSRVSIGDGLKVTWPDGTEEFAYPSRAGVGYPPVCIPADGRLAKIFRGMQDSSENA